MIVSGSASQALSAALSAELDEELSAVEFERFPDGEILAAAPGFDADRAVVVVSTVSATAHVETLQLQDAVREAGAEEVVTVLPYVGYARQDRPAKPGHTVSESPPGYPVSARAMARAVSAGTDRVVTVNPHEEFLRDFFDAPARSVDAAPLLADPLPDDLVDPLFLAPDDGAVDLARSARDAYGTGDVEAFEKRRLSGSEVEVTAGAVDLAGRDVAIVDDIVATGSTMSESVEHLRQAGASRVYATCVHPLLVGGALVRLRRAGVEAVYGTDTVERSVSAVSAAPAVADALRTGE
ncbi:ribose-phosphate pyrophosphokinase [Halobacteriales archaeon QS_8_69_26]|nr:MAG: ribose-phosphate pyrophosphokinase [Halobacteriales archaeon QS_8_69_26]